MGVVIMQGDPKIFGALRGHLCDSIAFLSPKARTPTHWMPSSDQILTQNDHSRSYKVIRFGVNEEPLRGYIVQYNHCGYECEGSEDIASERSENCHLRRSYTYLTPPFQQTPRISI